MAKCEKACVKTPRFYFSATSFSLSLLWKHYKTRPSRCSGSFPVGSEAHCVPPLAAVNRTCHLPDTTLQVRSQFMQVRKTHKKEQYSWNTITLTFIVPSEPPNFFSYRSSYPGQRNWAQCVNPSLIQVWDFSTRGNFLTKEQKNQQSEFLAKGLCGWCFFLFHEAKMVKIPTFKTLKNHGWHPRKQVGTYF